MLTMIPPFAAYYLISSHVDFLMNMLLGALASLVGYGTLFSILGTYGVPIFIMSIPLFLFAWFHRLGEEDGTF